MKGSRAVVLAIVAVVVLAGGWWLFSRGPGGEPIELISRLAAAEKRPADATFEVLDADLGGENKRAIFTRPVSRLIYKVQVPDNAWLRVSVGMKPEAWTLEGDGVLFRFGVSDGRTYDELFTQHVHPFANPGDRKWIQVWVDLSAYGGEEVDLIFNTNHSPPDRPSDDRNDLALWGTPELVVR